MILQLPRETGAPSFYSHEFPIINKETTQNTMITSAHAESNIMKQRKTVEQYEQTMEQRQQQSNINNKMKKVHCARNIRPQTESQNELFILVYSSSA